MTKKMIFRYLNLWFVLVLLTACASKSKQLYEPPNVKFNLEDSGREQINDSLFFKSENSLRKNSYGQWELVASGDALNLGNNIGSLSAELIRIQEHVFYEKMQDFVPSSFKQFLVKKFLTWYNRDIDNYISEEYKTELYGLSQHASKDLNFVDDLYLRTLYLHGAHDIGHALQDLAVVGCTSFAVWGDQTPDGNLLVARNLDFYVSEDFAQNKMIYFIQPENGHDFMSVSWAGMIGVMSGMNIKGITVTINAGKSDIPKKAKTPISLVAREILQYASNIEEAVEIARKKEVFVSESILVGSAEDNKAVIIEMSPNNFGVFEQENSSKLICTNHFQSKVYEKDENNLQQMQNSHSVYRMDRVEELLASTKQVSPELAVDILRDRNGLKNSLIGYGNEKALNQLLAHHGIVFQPQSKRVWVSSSPYQLGAFVSFQLDEVFASKGKRMGSLSDESFLIPMDPFLASLEYKNYELYRQKKKLILEAIDSDEILTYQEIVSFKSLNLNFWELYYLIGKYYMSKKYYSAALTEFNTASSLVIPSVEERNLVEENIQKIKRKLK